MASADFNKIKKAMSEIEKEIVDSLKKNVVPEFFGFLDKHKIRIEIDESVKKWDFAHRRAVYIIELSYKEIDRLSSINEYIKNKLRNKNLRPIDNINQNEIEQVKWIEFKKDFKSRHYIENDLKNLDICYIDCVIYY